MSPDRSTDYFVTLVRELRTLPRETEWVEFKANNSNPVEIGEYISALSRLLNVAIEAGAILVRDPEAGTRNRTYLPFWAGGSTAKEGIA